MSRVLVTGAAGFVARALVPALRRAGHEVVAATRAPSDAPWLADLERRAVGDIGPDTDWRGALAGIDAIVHLAARVHVLREDATDPLAAHRRINARGTGRLAEAAAAAGVRRFVFASTVKVNGERTATDRPFTDADPPAPEDPYAIAKREGEDALRAVAARTGLEAVIVRPPLVYGPGVGGNLLSLLRLCRRAPPLPLAAVRNRRSLIAAPNLADALVRCVGHPAAAGATFLVRDGEDVSTPELIRRLAAALGRPARLFPVPPGLLRLAGTALGRGPAVGRLLDSLAVDDRGIRARLDWTPPTSMAATLAATADWFAETAR